jgi:hypothetical protein
MKFINENTYSSRRVKISDLLNRLLHEFLGLTAAINLTVFFCKVNSLCCYSQKLFHTSLLRENRQNKFIWECLCCWCDTQMYCTTCSTSIHQYDLSNLVGYQFAKQGISYLLSLLAGNHLLLWESSTLCLTFYRNNQILYFKLWHLYHQQILYVKIRCFLELISGQLQVLLLPSLRENVLLSGDFISTFSFLSVS